MRSILKYIQESFFDDISNDLKTASVKNQIDMDHRISQERREVGLNPDGTAPLTSVGREFNKKPDEYIAKGLVGAGGALAIGTGAYLMRKKKKKE